MEQEDSFYFMSNTKIENNTIFFENCVHEGGLCIKKSVGAKEEE